MAKPKKHSTWFYLITVLVIILALYGLTKMFVPFAPIKYTTSQAEFSDTCTLLTDYRVCGDITIKNIDEQQRTAKFTFICNFITPRGTFTHEVSDILVFGEQKKFHCIGSDVELGESVNTAYKILATQV